MADKRKKKIGKEKPNIIEQVRAARMVINEDDQDEKLAGFMAIFHGKAMTKSEAREMRR